ncbi:MAG: methyltransferase, partial [Ktedonobacterales bacterium]
DEDLAQEGETEAETAVAPETVELATALDATTSADGDNASAATEISSAVTYAVTPAEQRQLGLHEQRLQAVMEVVRAAGAHSLADLGCGEGRLLALALRERSLARIFGMDVSSVALARARRRLHYDDLPPSQRQRIEIAQGSLLYRDKRLENFDVAALVEVIEHLDTPRLSAMERVVFAHARPRRVVITTPNREYNIHWEALGDEHLRHGDHRFEWTRTECAAWAARVAAAYGYSYTHTDLGPLETDQEHDIGAPSQMVVFDRLDGPVAGDAGEGVSAIAVERQPETTVGVADVADAVDAVERVEGDET